MSVGDGDPRHPSHAYFAPIVVGQFAERAAANPRICADCGLLDRHRNGCPSTPVHLLPTSCYVCGSAADHGPTFTETGKGHNFWSNADAAAEFAAQDRRTVAPPLRLEGPAFPNGGYGS